MSPNRRVLPVRARSLRASGDRWLFGYADIVTLLFACFASLYAMQSAPVHATPAARDFTLPKEREDAPPAPPVGIKLERDLADIAKKENWMPGVELTTSTRGLVISLPETGSFPPGRAELSDGVRRVMLSLANGLRDLANVIRVEGHTDDVPIHTAVFASNWELSTARATRVVQFLIGDGGLPAERLSAAGYAEHRPRVPNDSPESRARNRRVDIVVLEAATAAAEEPGAGRR
jgi:chemotaxis protein MotB